MHRTLKEETTKPPAANRREQQRRFDEFRCIFNEERPHEGLGLAAPAMHYQTSSRIYTGRLREPDYPDDHQVRRVRSNGEIKWLGGKVFVSAALIGEPIGIAETEDGSHTLHYGPIFLGYLDPGRGIRQSAPAASRKQKSPEEKV